MTSHDPATRVDAPANPSFHLLWGVVLAIVAAVLINLPLAHALLTTDEWRRNDVVTESSDEAFYLTRIREVADGHPTIGNPYIFKRRDDAYPLGTLWERILAFPMQAFGWRLKTVSILADLTLPFLLVFLAWWMARRSLPNPWWRSAFIGLLFLAGNTAVWKRPISPQATTVLPLLYFVLFFAEESASVTCTTARSALCGVMLYSYPFHWTYCLTAELLRCAWACWRRDVTNGQRFQRMACTILPFAVIAIPWAVSLVHVVGSSDYQETLLRLGFIHRHLPTGPELQLAAILAAAVLWWVSRRKLRGTDAALVILLVAGVLVLWQPLLTGKEAEFSSHYRQIIIIPLLLASLVILRTVARERGALGMLILAVLAAHIALATAVVERAEWGKFASGQQVLAARQQTEDVARLLGTLPPEQVIVTDAATADTVTTSTSHYVFTAYEAYMYVMPTAELKARARILAALIPDHHIDDRGIVGTQFVNETLYARTLCRLKEILTLHHQSCERIIVPCAVCDELRNTPPPDRETILTALRSAGAGYVLLPSAPPVLRPYLIPIGSTSSGSLTLFFLHYPS